MPYKQINACKATMGSLKRVSADKVSATASPALLRLMAATCEAGRRDD